MTATITERVEKGAAWLDTNRPGWVDRINPETLGLGEPCRCVLGQIWGGYGAGRAAVQKSDLGAATWPEQTRLVARLGFHSDLDAGYEFGWDENDDSVGLGKRVDAEYVDLTAAWRELIERRRSV